MADLSLPLSANRSTRPQREAAAIHWAMEIYCSVCGRKLCYTEGVINNWISVVPLAADPLIGLRPFIFPAMPEKEAIKWILEFT